MSKQESEMEEARSSPLNRITLNAYSRPFNFQVFILFDFLILFVNIIVAVIDTAIAINHA